MSDEFGADDFGDAEVTDSSDTAGGVDIAGMDNPLTLGNAAAAYGMVHAAAAVQQPGGSPSGAGDGRDVPPLELTPESKGEQFEEPPMHWFVGQRWTALDRRPTVWGGRFVLSVPPGICFGLWINQTLNVDNNTDFAIVFGGFLVLAWCCIPAFDALRLVVRPETGVLSRLAVVHGVNTGGEITAAACASLRRVRRAGLITAGFWSFAYTAFCGMGATLFFRNGQYMFSAATASTSVWSWVLGMLCAHWYVALRLAWELADDILTKVIQAIRTPGAASYSDVMWATTVYKPSIVITDVVMPTLSEFGPSLGFLTIGLGCFALSMANMAIQHGRLSAMILPSAVFAIVFALAWIPASVSSKFELLSTELNELRKQSTPHGTARIAQLEAYIAGCNRGQGVGFKIFGAVLNRQQLKVLAAKSWAVLFAMYLVLEPILHPPLIDLEALNRGSIKDKCENGWTHADFACYRLYREDSKWDGLSWPDAEAACQERGANLARISSTLQNNAVLAMIDEQSDLAKTGEVWIGLSATPPRDGEDGTWVWSDGEPLLFSDWGGSQGANYGRGNPKDGSGEFNTCEVGECVMVKNRQWEDNYCAMHDWSSCDPGDQSRTRPYICSKPATPGMASRYHNPLEIL
jgi:hypothetical protein